MTEYDHCIQLTAKSVMPFARAKGMTLLAATDAGVRQKNIYHFSKEYK